MKTRILEYSVATFAVVSMLATIAINEIGHSEAEAQITVTNGPDAPIVPVTDYPADSSLTNYTPVWVTTDRNQGIWVNFIMPSNKTFQVQYCRRLGGPWYARTATDVFHKDTQVMCGIPYQFYGGEIYCRTMHN